MSRHIPVTALDACSYYFLLVRSLFELAVALRMHCMELFDEGWHPGIVHAGRQSPLLLLSLWFKSQSLGMLSLQIWREC